MTMSLESPIRPDGFDVHEFLAQQLAGLQQSLEEKLSAELTQLRQENECLRDELQSVKRRNKSFSDGGNVKTEPDTPETINQEPVTPAVSLHSRSVTPATAFDRHRLAAKSEATDWQPSSAQDGLSIQELQ